MTKLMVCLTDLFKSYPTAAGKAEVLKGVDLAVEEGGATAIVGPSGSGKSTLLQLIAGLQRPDSGSVEVAGQKLELLQENALENFRSLNVGIIFQHHHLLMQCNAIENVLLPTVARNADPEKSKIRALELLEKVGLSHRAEHFPAQLSGGEQHRVAIARALINEPKLLLADEPTGFLEPKQGREIVELLAADRSYTLITVTHADYVAKAMDETYRLSDGQLKKQ